jgi:hypothetical protein
MRAFETARDGQEWRLHIQMMVTGKLTRIRRDAMTAFITAQPKTLA